MILISDRDSYFIKFDLMIARLWSPMKQRLITYYQWQYIRAIDEVENFIMEARSYIWTDTATGGFVPDLVFRAGSHVMTVTFACV